MLMGDVTLSQTARLIRLSVAKDVRELLKTVMNKDDPGALLECLREAAMPNRDAERFWLLNRALRWRQGSRKHMDYVHGFEKVNNQLAATGIRLDATIRAYILLQGLTNPSEKTILLSQALGILDYDIMRKSVLSLGSARPTETGRYSQAYVADNQEEDR